MYLVATCLEWLLQPNVWLKNIGCLNQVMVVSTEKHSCSMPFQGCFNQAGLFIWVAWGGGEQERLLY